MQGSPLLVLIRNGIRLALFNPRAFSIRMRMLMRHPVLNLGALIRTRRRYQIINDAYELWLGETTAFPESEAPSRDGPLLSVILPVYEVEARLLEAAIESVRSQSYPRWELCVADDASRSAHVRKVIDRCAQQDERIRVVYRPERGHISAASNSALGLASGEFIVLLDHDDLLTPDALSRVARVVREHPEVDFIYSDEDKLELDGRRVEPFFKPAWSPTLLTSCNYITHLAAIRRSLVLDVGGFRNETVGSQDYDLFLRVSERARAIAHVPRVLYSWRKIPTSAATGTSAKPYTVQAAERALEDAIERRGLPARLEPSHLNGLFLVRYHVPAQVSASLIITGPGTDWWQVLDTPGITVQDVTFLQELENGPAAAVPSQLRVAPDISGLTGDYLIWIDGASKPGHPLAVRDLLEYLQPDGVAVVGGMTHRADTGTVHQAGLAVDLSGQPLYCFTGLPALPQPNFYLNLKDLPREVAAVSVACCAMRRETWDVLGGWRADLPPSLVLSDLCLRALALGCTNVYTPLARFDRRHPLPPLPDVRLYLWPWNEFVDPYWNPNLDPSSEDGLPFRAHADRSARVRPGFAIPSRPCRAERSSTSTEQGPFPSHASGA